MDGQLDIHKKNLLVIFLSLIVIDQTDSINKIQPQNCILLHIYTHHITLHSQIISTGDVSHKYDFVYMSFYHLTSNYMEMQ